MVNLECPAEYIFVVFYFLKKGKQGGVEEQFLYSLLFLSISFSTTQMHSKT